MIQKAVMLAVLAVGLGATTLDIKREIKARVGPSIRTSGLTNVIRVLAVRNLLIVEKAPRDPEFIGQTPNIHFVTEAGLEALRKTLADDDAMRAGIDLDEAKVIQENNGDF